MDNAGDKKLLVRCFRRVILDVVLWLLIRIVRNVGEPVQLVIASEIDKRYNLLRLSKNSLQNRVESVGSRGYPNDAL